MRVCFCVWCVKRTKYLAFDTFERADESVLIIFHSSQFETSLFSIQLNHKHGKGIYLNEKKKKKDITNRCDVKTKQKSLVTKSIHSSGAKNIAI